MSMTTQYTARRAAQNRKASFWLLGILIGFFAILLFGKNLVGLFAFPIIYSEGDRVGQVLKLSRKGLVWKTGEASMGITQSGAYVQLWNFSVDSQAQNEDELMSALTDAYRSGRILKVHYIQHVGVRPWRGGTSYFIQSISEK